jgi:hypothetical protein
MDGAPATRPTPVAPVTAATGPWWCRNDPARRTRGTIVSSLLGLVLACAAVIPIRGWIIPVAAAYGESGLRNLPGGPTTHRPHP